MSKNSSFVYVNGEKMSLLEDGRLPLAPRFPPGTILLDPSELPPREVPLTSDPAEASVTATRLIPYGHYHAFLSDNNNNNNNNNNFTGEYLPLTGESVCVYVSNLPPHTTAEMLGRFFEAFDMVAEADVFTTPAGVCSGRGWVVLQDPAKLLMVPPVMEFFPRNFIYTALSDKVPSRATLIPSNPAGMQVLSRVGANYDDPIINHSRNSNYRRSNGMGQHGNSFGNIPKPPSALTASIINSSSYYFVAAIFKNEVEKSVEGGIFWPSPENRRAFYSTLDRGPVILIFVLQECAALFGYARLLPQREIDINISSGCPIEWMKHHVFLQEEDLRVIQSLPIARMGDGIPLKPEIGESICHLADRFPTLSIIPERLSNLTNNGRNIGRGSENFNHFNNGIHPIGDRGLIRSNITASPLQPLGARQITRGNHTINSINKIPPRRRSYNDFSNAYSPLGGSVIPPRKI